MEVFKVERTLQPTMGNREEGGTDLKLFVLKGLGVGSAESRGETHEKGKTLQRTRSEGSTGGFRCLMDFQT
jgi:hypothetical protein